MKTRPGESASRTDAPAKYCRRPRAAVLADPEGRADTAAEPVETLRVLAVLMLVSYHVIGGDPSSGLEIDYPSRLRIGADFLANLRMPAFAFVAGYVYAVRPVMPGAWQTFMRGKVRRLLLPGAVATTIFATLRIALTPSELGWDIWRIYLFPYAHYWFLQAIFLVFATVALVEAFAGPRRTPWMIPPILALYFLDYVPMDNIFAIKQAVYLAPYFLAGIFYARYVAEIRRNALVLGAVSLLAVGLAIWYNIHTFTVTHHVSTATHDLDSLAMGLFGPVLLMLVLPNLTWLARFGPFAFTIYLYHVLGTAGAHLGLTELRVESLGISIAVGMAAGLALPIAIHLLSLQYAATRRLILGYRR